MANYIWKKYNSTLQYTWRQYGANETSKWTGFSLIPDSYSGYGYSKGYREGDTVISYTANATRVQTTIPMQPGSTSFPSFASHNGNYVELSSDRFFKVESRGYLPSGPTWSLKTDGSGRLYSKAYSTVYVKGSYIGDVTSTSSTTYPTNGKSGSYWYDTRTSDYIKSYIGEVIAEDGTYPTDGLASDGYWYVKGEMVLLAIYKNQSIKTIKYKNQDTNKLYNRGETLWHTYPYVYLAQDSDFVKVNGHWVYRGAVLEVEIPTHINGELVTSTSYMFSGTSDYQATPVTKVFLNHSNVTNMYSMFYESSATTLDLSSFNTSNVTNMGYMFGKSSATTLDLSNFNTSRVTDMSYMFGSSSAPTLNLSSFNTSNVTNMSAMFQSSSATALNLSSFNTSKVTNMTSMLRGSSVTSLDLSNFNTSNVTNMSAMFMDCSSLTSLDLSSFDTTKLVTTTSMFENCISITIAYARTQADINKFNASSNKPTGLSFVYLAQDSDFVKYSSRWVYRGAALEVEIPTHINGELVTSTYSMFRGGSTYKATPVTKVVLNHSNVTNMGYMFRDSSVTTLDLPIFDTSNVTSMSYMFYNSKAIILDLSSFDTSKVTSRSYMFRNASATTGYARTQADADKFNTSSQKPAGLTFIVKP